MLVDGLGLSPELVQRLERLTLISRFSHNGLGSGLRRSPAAGSSVEFADYRTYAPGDDFRRVDWNAYARLGRLFLRVFEAEENTVLTLFLDCSQSMSGGEPGKINCMKTVAAALAYIALASYDRIAVIGFSDSLGAQMRPRSGRAAAIDVWRFIANLTAGGETRFECLRKFPALRPLPGIAIVLSDFQTDSDWRGSLAALRIASRQDVTALQILAPQELHPDFDGDWTLCDAETGHEVAITANIATLDRYRRAQQTHSEELAGWCRRNAIQFAQISSDANIDQLVFRLLARTGVAR